MSSLCFRACCVCLALSTGTAIAGQVSLPTTLDILLPDGEYAIVASCTFENFTYAATGDMPVPSQILVDALGSNGLTFVGPFYDLPGGVGNGASAAMLGFTVTGTLSGAVLAGDPTVQGAPGIASVTETFLDTGLPDTVDLQLDIFNNVSPPGDTALRVEDSTDFGTVIHFARVVKGILLLSQSTSERASLSMIEQQFTPEPSGIALTLLGLLCLAFSGWCRRCKCA